MRDQEAKKRDHDQIKKHEGEVLTSTTSIVKQKPEFHGKVLLFDAAGRGPSKIETAFRQLVPNLRWVTRDVGGNAYSIEVLQANPKVTYKGEKEVLRETLEIGVELCNGESKVIAIGENAVKIEREKRKEEKQYQSMAEFKLCSRENKRMTLISENVDKKKKEGTKIIEENEGQHNKQKREEEIKEDYVIAGRDGN